MTIKSDSSFTKPSSFHHLRSSVLRGGRLTKFKGIAASIAPMMGGEVSLLRNSVSALAVGAAMLVAPATLPAGMGAAYAGTCTVTVAGSGVWSCAGPAGADVTQTPTPALGGALEVSTADGFGITTATGNAITLINTAADSDIIFTDDFSSTIISGAQNGINSKNNGIGELSITTSGPVEGGSSGIYARNYGTDLVITTNGSVTGSGFFVDGINATNEGTGVLIITANDTVSAEGFGFMGAIVARTGDKSSGLEITTQKSVIGNANGILATIQNGGGDLSITTNGIVKSSGPDENPYTNSSEGFNGISAIITGRNGRNLTVVSNEAVIGSQSGIRTRNEGTGQLSITTSGWVTNTVTNADYNQLPTPPNPADPNDPINWAPPPINASAIYASNYGTDLIIVTNGDVTGAEHGMLLLQHETSKGVLDVTMSGDVYGGVNGITNGDYDAHEYGVNYGRDPSGKGGTFTITQTGSLSGGSGTALLDASVAATGDPSSTLNVYGALNGNAFMGEGSDFINIYDDASLQSAIILNGGNSASSTSTREVDRLTFSNWSGSDTTGRSDATIIDIDGAQLVNMEEVFLTKKADVTFGDEITPGTGLVNQSQNGLLLQVEKGSIARFSDDFTVFGDVNNFGSLDLSAPNLTVGTILNITGNYAAASNLFLDVMLNDGGSTNLQPSDATFADQMIIAGNVSGQTKVFVNNVGGTGALTDLNANDAVRNVSTTLRQWLLDFRLGFLPLPLVD